MTDEQLDEIVNYRMIIRALESLDKFQIEAKGNTWEVYGPTGIGALLSGLQFLAMAPERKEKAK